MRIMHVVTTLHRGGIETLVTELSKVQVQANHEVAVCAVRGLGVLAEALQEIGAEVLCAAGDGSERLRSVGRLSRFIFARRPEIVHAHNSLPLVFAALGSGIGWRPRLVCTRHSIAMDGNRGGPRRAEQLAIPLCDAFVAVSERVRKRAMAVGRISARRSVTIYNGVDTSRFFPTASGVLPHPRTPRYIHVARLSEEKRHEDLLRALSIVLDSFPGARLLLVGDGPLGGELHQQCQCLGIADRVEFLGHRNDVPELLRDSDALVLASRVEGLPLTVLEGMASGLPVVATDVGGVCEAIQHGQNGLLVPARQPGLLAQAMVEIVSDPERAKSMAREGRRIAEEKFSLTAMATQYERLYQELLDGNGRFQRSQAQKLREFGRALWDLGRYESARLIGHVSKPA